MYGGGGFECKPEPQNLAAGAQSRFIQEDGPDRLHNTERRTSQV